MAELCQGYQYKQGVGILNTVSVKVLNVGNFKVAEKVVGKPSIFNKAKVYTGFNPSFAQYITQDGKYIAIFDYDTDVQLDVHEIFTVHGKVTPEEKLLQEKIMAGSMWNAIQRTRAEREKIPWWKSINFVWLLFFLTVFFFIYFWFHGTPINAVITVRVIPTALGNATYVQTVNNATINTGIVGAINGAAHGAVNAITGAGGSIAGTTGHSNLSIIP